MNNKTACQCNMTVNMRECFASEILQMEFKIKHHVKMKECGGASSLASRSTSKLPQGKESAIVWVKMWPRDSPAEE